MLNWQECNVTSDGFHEALFIEKSPSKQQQKQQQSLKKRRKSKKPKEMEGKALRDRESKVDRKEGKARETMDENRTRDNKTWDQ